MIVHQKISYLDLLSFLTYPHFSYFRFIVLICTMGKKIGNFSNIIYWNYPLQHSRKLFYRIKLIIHHLQVIRHEHPSHLNLIIKTLLQIKTITTPQIQMTAPHVWHHKNKITVFRPHLQPLVWRHWTLHYILHLLSHIQQQKTCW